MIDFQKAFKLGRPFFQKVARKVLKMHKRNIFDRGLNAANKKFAAYTPAYKKRKIKADLSMVLLIQRWQSVWNFKVQRKKRNPD
jgi:hypothetical protein